MRWLSFGRTNALWMLLSRSAVFAMIVSIAGCAGLPLPASVKGGECKVFDRPEYEVRGARRYDQNWIDGNIEAGVGGCNWARPKARPPALDAEGPAPVVIAPAKPVKKPSLWSRTKGVAARVRDRVHRPSAGSVTPLPAGPNPLAIPPGGTPATFDPPSTPVAPEPPAPAPKPRKPIDELLHPSR
jgi:hypothetical protein